MASIDDRWITTDERGKRVRSKRYGVGQRYRARWREHPGGPQRTKCFVRKIDAQRFLVEVQHGLASGSYVDPTSAVTLDDYVKVHLARQPWRTATSQSAAAALAHAQTKLGKRRLSTIRKGDVQALVTGLELAPGTVRIVHQHLNALFAAAIEDRLLVVNPARKVKLPSSDAKQLVVPTPQQVAALHDAAPEGFRAAIVLGAGLGLRQAEAAALSVDRIDWLGRSVRIDRQWIDKQSSFGPPKTDASVRTIPASPAVITELSRMRHLAQSAFVVGDGKQPTGYNRWRWLWVQTVKDAGLSGIRYHDLRHAFASALISGGCSVKAVQLALGHSSATTTLDVYGHLWPGDEDRIRDAIDKAFAPAEDSLRTETDDANAAPQVTGQKGG
jgi:integrase